MLRPALCLIALVSVALGVVWLESDPADPRRRRVEPAATGATVLLVYSPRGWLSQSLDWESPVNLPIGWNAIALDEPSVAGVDELHAALTAAECRALAEPQAILQPIPMRKAQGSAFDCVVYPVWDIQDLVDSVHPDLVQPDPLDGQPDPFGDEPVRFVGHKPPFLASVKKLSLSQRLVGVEVLSGAILVNGPPEDQDRIHKLVESCQRQLSWQRTGEFIVAPRGRLLAFHATWHFGATVELEEVLRRILWPVNVWEKDGFGVGLTVCSGGVIVDAEPASHAAIQALLDDAHVIRTVQPLVQGSPARRRKACLTALADDDQLAIAVAIQQLTNEDHAALGHEAVFILETAIQRADFLDSNFYGWFWNVRDRLSPEDTARVLTDLVRTTPSADRLASLLTVAIRDESKMVRQAAQAGILARLPRHGLPVWGGEKAAPEAPLWPPSEEREQFFVALHQQLCKELAPERDLTGPEMKRVVSVTLEALAGALHCEDAGPARSRLCELGGWLATHPIWSCAFLGPNLPYRDYCDDARVAALAERLRDSSPDVRRQALRLLHERVRLDPSVPNDALQAIEALRGDPYTADLFPPPTCGVTGRGNDPAYSLLGRR